MFSYFLILLALYVIFSAALVIYRYFIGQDLAGKAVRFEQTAAQPTKKVLVIGDSTAVGVGASSKEKSVAGLLGADFPNISVVNKGVSGMRVAGLLEEVQKLEGQKYDIVILQIGGNDIVHFTDPKSYTEDIDTIFKKAREIAPTVLVLHGGDITNVPFFPWPANFLYLGSTERLRSIFQQAAARHGVLYVDIYTAEKRDPRSRIRRIWFAGDAFHPSDTAYKYWYDQVRKTFSDHKVTL